MTRHSVLCTFSDCHFPVCAKTTRTCSLGIVETDADLLMCSRPTYHGVVQSPLSDPCSGPPLRSLGYFLLESSCITGGLITHGS
jgi:hypothetical protein